MKMTRYAFLAALCLTIASMATAATYTANGAGAILNSSTIGGVAADYPSLAAAATDYNSIPGGLAGNYTFFIDESTTETTNVTFGAPTNTFTLTFKPSPGKTPKIRFVENNDNAGFSGGWMIGPQNLTSLDALANMPNVTIDGSNTVAGTTRDLTIEFANNFSNDLTADGDNGGFPTGVNFAGMVDGAVVKNVNINFPVTSAFLLANTRSVYALRFSSRRNAVTLTNDVPDNWTVQNCYIYAVGSRAGHGIGATASGTITAGTAQTGALIEGNDIIGQTRGMLLNANANFIVRNNRVRVNQTANAGALVSSPIVHASSNAATPWTSEISGNVLDSIVTAADAAGGGLAGMQVSGAPAALGTQYNIYNNIITGFQFTTATVGDYVIRGIESGSSQSFVNMYHNSINIPNIPVINGTTGGRVAGVVFTATGAVNNFTFKNNIFRYAQLGTTSSVFIKGNTTLPTSNNNNIFIDGAVPFVARFGALAAPTVTHATWASWQGAGFDVASVQKDPFVADAPATGVWTSATNLKFTADPGPAYNGDATLIATVPTDIEGQARTRPVMGADEIAAASSVSDWMMY